jgi:hypothetical protein
MEVLSKTTKILSQDSQSVGRDLNPEPPEYEARVLTIRQQRSENNLLIVLIINLKLNQLI